MKRMMRSGNGIRRSVSLLLLMSLLITLLPSASVAETAVGAYGSVTVTTKNVVIRTSPAGSRTGYFAQKGTYPMIGPVIEVDGVNWYNLQTDDTGGFVSGLYATANFGSAGMPSTDKTYVDILAATTIIKGDDPTSPELDGSSLPITVSVAAGSILQLVDATPYTATVGGVSSTYINLYYYNGTDYSIYHTLYTANFVKGIMTQDNLNTYISDVTWAASTTGLYRDGDADGDYLTHALQAALYVLGYYDDDVDGFYGDNTKDAVMDFRADNSMAVTTDVADAAVFKEAFEQAIAMLEYIRSTPGLNDEDGTTATSTMIQTTVKNLRIRKSYSTSSAYIGMITDAGTILTYTRTYVNGTVTWYYIQYNGIYGWVMGTYVEAYTTSSGSSGSSSTITNYGSVTITKKLVAIRTSPNGSRSGYHVNTGDVCTMIGPSVEAGGYTWYYIRTENGREGYVRGDCAEADFGSAGMPSFDTTYVQFLYTGTEIRKGSDPATATDPWITIPQNTICQLVTGTTYTSSDITYINIYYNNEVYHTKYTTAFTDGLMSENNVNNYIIDTIWAQAFGSTETAGNNDTLYIRNGDIRVHAIQAALYQLGYFDDNDEVDGTFGDDTEDAVKEFQDDYSLTKDGLVGSTTSAKLFTEANTALILKRTASASSDDDDVNSAGDFGTVTKVIKGSWAAVDGGATSLFPKGSTVSVMAVDSKKVFRLYRWSGANHADCVPYDATDTAVLCSVLGVSYSSAAPSSSELSLIKGAGDDDWPDYTWPKFRWAGVTYANDDKIPVWVNLNGTVYCASIYVIPHGFTGTSSFSLSKLNGQYYYERNNMYGMLCVHFYGSTTHATGTVSAAHMNNINYAYNKAASYFGSGKVQ